MAYRLKNRQTGIPTAIRFHQPELNWSSRPGSFENIVGQIVAIRLANPNQTRQHGWATDHEAVASELDAYLAKVCLDHGWNKFVTSGVGDSPPPPSARPGLRRSAGNAVAGAKILVEWISSGAEAVPVEVSNARAEVCAKCPLNKSGDLLAFFTRPVSEAIRSALSLRSQWSLTTPVDGQLGVCEACGCPLKLKVHLPIGQISPRLSAEEMAALHEKCWIRSETGVVSQ